MVLNIKEGRETTKDDPRPERLSTSTTDDNIEKIATLIYEDRCLSTQALAERTGMGIEILDILHSKFNVHKVCAKIVPKFLTPERKESKKNICANVLNNI